MADTAARSRLLRNAGIGVFACICLVLFVWIRFPYDSIKNRIEAVLEGALGTPVTLGHISPNLLWGFTIKGVDIKGVPVAKELTITPRPWDIFRGSLGFGFDAALVAGTTEGYLRVPFRRKSTDTMEVSLDMAGVDLTGMSEVFPPGMTPAGVLTGKFNLSAPRESMDKATGGLTLSWKKGSLPLGMKTLPFDALTFENLDMEGRIEKGLLSLDKADFTGDFSGNMTGNIRFSRDISRSRLNITGELTLPEAMRNALGAEMNAASGQGTRFSLRGSLERPRFRMLGQAGVGRAPRPRPDMAADRQIQPPGERRVTETSRQEAPEGAPELNPMNRRLQERSEGVDLQEDQSQDQEGD